MTTADYVDAGEAVSRRLGWVPPTERVHAPEENARARG